MKIELEQAFETLGVPSGASASDVRSAYRTLIRAHHPDHVSGDAAAANERLAEINAAKDLIDRTPAPTRRTKAPSGDRAQTPPSSPADDRARREAQARAFRKAMEARAQAGSCAESEARRAEEEAARNRAQRLDQSEAAERAAEEARRKRHAVFEAALAGKNPNAGQGSLLRRLRTLGGR